MRRFDKKANMVKANLLAEQRYLKSNSLINESILKIEEEKHLFDKWLLESLKENNINIEQIIKESNIDIEDKDSVNEAGLIALTAAGVLSGGKVIEVLGSLIKKMVNYLRRKGIMKGDQIVDKNGLEKFGQFIQKQVMKLFKGIVKIILAPIAEVVSSVWLFNQGADTAEKQKANKDKAKEIYNKINNEKLIEDIASALFYAAVVFVGIQGAKEIHAFLFGGGPGIFTAVFELITTGAKLYEIVLLIVAVILTTFVQDYKNINPKNLAHSLDNCLESPGGVRALIKKMKSVSKDVKFSECVNKSLGQH